MIQKKRKLKFKIISIDEMRMAEKSFKMFRKLMNKPKRRKNDCH